MSDKPSSNRSLWIALSVVGGVLLLCIVVPILVASVSVAIPMVQERNRRLSCQRNLAGLGALYVEWAATRSAKPVRSGPGLFLEFRQKRRIEPGSESTLICPGDVWALMPMSAADSERWDDADLDAPDPMLFSYAVRDFARFPLPGRPTGQEIIACDRNGLDGREPHHADGLCVLFSNGSARFVSWEELGCDPEAPPSVGPDSEHAELAKLIGATPR